MCGIVSCISRQALDQDVIVRMTSALNHRGPDAQGVYFDLGSRIAMGHTRLSIIDLSAEANQPFFSANQRYVVVFNGEIYNFKSIRKELSEGYDVTFKTHSDTEVIVEAFAQWGTQMVRRLNGMFAIVIVDRRDHKMYFFRDRVGKKPLYYFLSQDLFAMASEIKSLLVHPTIGKASINKAVIGDFLHLGYLPGAETIYHNIYKFPAGHIGEIDLDLNLLVVPFWSIDDSIDMREISDYANAKSQLVGLLNESVRKRMISDVPLGSFLSGGIDSSLVTAIAVQQSNSPLKTFSIGFNENKFDEMLFASKVAKYLGTDHAEYRLSEKDAIDLVETCLHHFDEPFADTSAIPTMMVSGLARKQVKVALTGDGGDELFQGYGAYAWADRLDSLPWKAMRYPMSLVLNASGNNRFQRIAQLLQPEKVGGIRSHIFSQEQYLFSQEEIRDKVLLKDNYVRPFFYDEKNSSGRDLTAGERQAIFDFKFYLADDLLVKVDRASMFYALECRCPLLDYHIVELATRLKVDFKKKGKLAKFILKDILSEIIPAELIDRPKKGFSVPLSKWLKSDLRYLVDTFLDDALIESAGLVNVAYCRELKRDYFNGRDYLYNKVWVLIVLHKWWRDNA